MQFYATDPRQKFLSRCVSVHLPVHLSVLLYIYLYVFHAFRPLFGIVRALLRATKRCPTGGDLILTSVLCPGTPFSLSTCTCLARAVAAIIVQNLEPVYVKLVKKRLRSSTFLRDGTRDSTFFVIPQNTFSQVAICA